MGPEVVIQVVRELRETGLNIVDICKLLGVPRSNYYRWLKKDWTVKDEVELAVIELCAQHKRRYGYRRIAVVVSRRLGKRVNHKRVLRLMRKNHILSLVRKRRRQFFSGGQEAVIAPNRIERNFKATAPNQKWFTDVSYLPFGEQWLYFSSVLDGFNNEIVSYKVSARQDIKLAMETLKDACESRDTTGTVLHSDQGGIYTSKQFQQYAKEKGIVTSMSRKGNCHDNAAIESFHSHLKAEAFYAQNIKYTSNSIVIQTVEDYIHYYNNERIQAKLNYLSPNDYRRQVI